MQQNSLSKQHITQLISSIIIVFLIGYISSFFTTGIDLTQEKRFTLNPITKDILKSLPEGILVKVYLEGDMPNGFKKLRTSTQDMLDQFRMISGNKIDYVFVNPFEEPNLEQRKKIIETLYDKGLQPTNVKMKDENENQSEKMLIPGALISFNNKELPVNLLMKSIGLSSDINLNNSVEGLEYLLMNALVGVTKDSTENIAIIEGHDELSDYQTADFTRELEMNLRFKVFRGTLNGNVNCLNPYKIIVVAKPQQSFSEEDKFIIDQYIMNGGKIIWLIDQVRMDIDSLAAGTAIATISKNNLEDQLFRYGIRINSNLLQDVQCSMIPINIALTSEAAKFVPTPYLYLPLLMPSDDHVISKNLNLVRCEFANTIDTVGNNHQVKKTVLLRSSTYSRIVNAPVMVSLEDVKRKMQRADFNAPSQVVALLLEGSFQSVFKNRLISNLKLNGNYLFKENSKSTQMIAIADGDIIRNNVRQTSRGMQIMPLGFDRYSNQTYGNKEFIMNIMNYLSDDKSLLELRQREIKLRLLDKQRLKENKTTWQLINTVLPILCVFIAGILINLFRRRRFI